MGHCTKQRRIEGYYTWLKLFLINKELQERLAMKTKQYTSLLEELNVLVVGNNPS